MFAPPALQNKLIMFDLQRQPSLLKIPLRKIIPRSNSVQQRLVFPGRGDSSIFWGVGKKYYGGNEDKVTFEKPPVQASERSIFRSVSERNILSVSDIQGASPSVASEKIKNIMRGKSNTHALDIDKKYDVLGQFEKIFALKKIVVPSQKPYIDPVHLPSISNPQKSLPINRKTSPTYTTTLALS